MTFLNKIQQAVASKTNSSDTKNLNQANKDALLPGFTNNVNSVAGDFIKIISDKETAPANLYDDETEKLAAEKSELDRALLEQDLTALGDDNFNDYMYYKNKGSYSNHTTYYYDSNQNKNYETLIEFDSSNEKSIQSYLDENNSKITCIYHTDDSYMAGSNSQKENVYIHYDNNDSYYEIQNARAVVGGGFINFNNCNFINITRGNEIRKYNVEYDENGVAKNYILVEQKEK